MNIKIIEKKNILIFENFDEFFKNYISSKIFKSEKIDNFKILDKQKIQLKLKEEIDLKNFLISLLEKIISEITNLELKIK